MVVVFALGTRGTGGHAARIERLRTCVTTQAETNPFHVVATTRQVLPVEVVSRVEVHECE